MHTVRQTNISQKKFARLKYLEMIQCLYNYKQKCKHTYQIFYMFTFHFLEKSSKYKLNLLFKEHILSKKDLDIEVYFSSFFNELNFFL